MRFPCVTKITRAGHEEYVIIESIQQGQVQLHQWNKTLGLQAFQNIWQESTLLIYDTTQNRLPESLAPYLSQKRLNTAVSVTLIVTLIVTVLWKLVQAQQLEQLPIALAYLLLSGTGLWISHLIVLKSRGHTSDALSRFCYVKKADGCDMILRSSLAYLLPGVSWASIGMTFFSGAMLYFFISPLPDPSVLGFTYLLTLPGVVLALIIQQVLSELWCKLCLAIHALLVGGIILGLSWHDGWFWPDITGFTYLVLAMLLGWVGWQLYRQYLDHQSDGKMAAQDLKTAKFHPQTVSCHFSESASLPFPMNLALTLGEEDARISILLITNPVCPNCAAAHHHIHELMEQSDEVSLNILFHTYEDEPDTVELVQCFHQLYLKDHELFLSGLKDWYEDVDQPRNRWIKKYSEHLQDTDEKSEQLPLISSDAVGHVPAVYLNGAMLPEFYETRDIFHLLPQLRHPLT
ncbi:MAG: vitamin K epoxide reductase family protein [Cytophagales bacterium]|nr:vitamin K epoxide reductase family protein [Cytophagales bacterium]